VEIRFPGKRSSLVDGLMLQLMRSQITMRSRITVSLMIGLCSGAFCWTLLRRFQLGAGDFNWSFDAARALLAHRDPFTSPPPGVVPYPLPAALFALPFAAFPRELAAAIFFGVGSGLLAFGLTREGYTRLLLFLAYPYWAALLVAQWTPLITAVAFFPFLLPLTMAKPQVGLPVALTHLSRRGAAACFAVLLLTFILMPDWPAHWIPQLKGYQHYFPILVLPGPILLLALLRYRDSDAQLLFLASIMPQRWFYDPLILWLIPKSRREILATVFFSWGAGIWRWYHMPTSFTQVGRWTVLFIYLPMLVVVLRRRPKTVTAQVAPDR